jgi:nucleotide-binding universal stress UspA family protein
MLRSVEAAGGPILIAFDGSDASRRAIADAASLLGPRRALVATVWEAGLAYAAPEMRGDGLTAFPIDPELARQVDEDVHMHAERIAREGAELATSLGLQAEPLAIIEERDIPDTIVQLARENAVAAIVVGSRGLSGLRARLEGSTTKGLLKLASCPVIVVHEPHEDD